MRPSGRRLRFVGGGPKPAALPDDLMELVGETVYDDRDDTLLLYFLARSGEVVYVGITRDTLRQRASAHRVDKSFDALFYRAVHVALAEAEEREWIAKLRPQYNSAGLRTAYTGYSARKRPAAWRPGA